MSKAPTGITISRNGGNYSVSWKCGDKNYGKGQQFQYKINSGKWTSLSVGAGTRSKTVAVNLANYYPTKSTILYSVSVRIRGKVNSNKSKWSAWSAKTYTNYVPNVPSLEASLDDQQTNKCTFTWNLTTETTDAKPYYHVRWETILVKESDVTDGSKLTWDSSALGWDTGAGSYASSVTKIEDTTLLANDSYTRWFRVCGRGARGSSDWRYAKHVYARPYQAKIEEAEVTRTDAEGLTCYARWKADQTASHPIDYTTVQYLITVPNAGLTCPSGAQWSDANISADTSDTDAVRFSIDDVLDKDECLFVRVNTVHDTNVTYSEPKLASVGDLKDPTDLSYQVDNANYTLTSVSVDNNSDVPDSFIAIVYRAGSNPEDELVVGIIPHGASQPLVTPVQCPDWSGESAFSIGAYAAVGTYNANSVGYTVKAKMRSASTIWVGGAVPVAPENVNVAQSPITGTATVTWDWTWEEANFAQLSWTDHDDAWESTDEPEIYNITKPKATKWNISGLELGKKWFIAVRLVSGNPEEENAIYSPWSDMKDIILSSVPNVPSLNLSARVITEGEEITASWDFVSNDGTGQISAEIKDEDDNLIAHTETQKEVVIDTEALGWSQGETHSLSVRVTSESNRTTDWSNPVSIVVAEALEGYIAETSLEMKTVEVNPESFDEADLISFDTEQEEVFTSLQVDLEPVQDLHGYDAPWVGGAGKNKVNIADFTIPVPSSLPQVKMFISSSDVSSLIGNGKTYIISFTAYSNMNGTVIRFDGQPDNIYGSGTIGADKDCTLTTSPQRFYSNAGQILSGTQGFRFYRTSVNPNASTAEVYISDIQLEEGSTATTYAPYENICPISGHTEVDVERTGKNLLNTALFDDGYFYTANEDGSITVSANDTRAFDISRSLYVKAGTYTISRSNTSGVCNIRDLTNNVAVGYMADGTASNTFTLTKDCHLGVRIGATASSYPFTVNVQLELGTPATTYEPYQEQSYHQDIEATYGGTLDVVSGVLTVTHGVVDLGTLNWITLTASSTGKQYFETQNEVADMKKSTGNTYVQPIISSHYKPETWQNTLDRTGYDGSIAEGWAGKSYIVIYDSSKATLSASEFKTAMNGVQLVYPLAEPQTYQLTPQQIQTLVGQNNVWSENGEITARIAETYKDVLSLTEMPLTVELAGVNDNIISTLTIERTADYHMDRPDETQFDGFEGEIVYLTTQNGGEDIIINQEDLIGLMDDEASYRIFVTFKDVYGQSMNDSVDFEVHWEHQAIIPEATVEIDSENLIAKLTPVAPTGTLEGDTCDIYRLSADRPELIVKDAVFGTQYVDPYPAIGEFGGHRFVFKTANGDYITEDNDIAWTDTGAEDGDILESERAIIDFDGNQLLLYYNVDVGHQWDKDFQQTKYLGGSIQGDWNAGVSRSGSISAVMITLTDSDQIRMLRELAVYTGVCHVRTTDGSSYTADVQVAEDRDHDDYGKLASFSLTITRVDAETLDGLTYQQWAEEE